jgi:hypothetical protein
MTRIWMLDSTYYDIDDSVARLQNRLNSAIDRGRPIIVIEHRVRNTDDGPKPFGGMLVINANHVTRLDAWS